MCLTFSLRRNASVQTDIGILLVWQDRLQAVDELYNLAYSLFRKNFLEETWNIGEVTVFRMKMFRYWFCRFRASPGRCSRRHNGPIRSRRHALELLFIPPSRTPHRHHLVFRCYRPHATSIKLMSIMLQCCVWSPVSHWRRTATGIQISARWRYLPQWFNPLHDYWQLLIVTLDWGPGPGHCHKQSERPNWSLAVGESDVKS